MDKELIAILKEEKARQENTLELIASESIQPNFILEMQGSIFCNKTAVGNIGNQRLKGSAVIEKLEILAEKRATEVFGADYANMFPYSGSMANFCAYSAVCNIGDKILALDPMAGAHQSHGGKKNVSSRIYNFSYFGLKQDGKIDYEEADKKATEEKPVLIVVGSAAYPRQIDYKKLAEIAHKNNAFLMADIAHFSGLIAGGVSDNPFPYADIVTASCTKTMCGPHTGFIMCKKHLEERVKNAVYPGNIASLHLQTIAGAALAIERTKKPEFALLMKNIVENAKELALRLQEEGFAIFTGGTDCHIILADCSHLGINGVDFTERAETAGISVNSKAIPFDKSPIANGIRLGTTVLTQRGMKKEDMSDVAKIFTLIAKNDTKTAKAEVERLVRKFPVPNDII